MTSPMNRTDPLDPRLRIQVLGGPHQPLLLAAGSSLTSALLLVVFGFGSLLVALGVLGFAGLALYVLARMEVALANRRSQASFVRHVNDLGAMAPTSTEPATPASGRTVVRPRFPADPDGTEADNRTPLAA